MQQLQTMLDRYEEFRRNSNLPRGSDTPENTGAGRTPAAEEAPARSLPQRQRDMLDHQLLAERVGAEARSIAVDLRRRQLPGAERFDRDALPAFHTGRHVHMRRQRDAKEGHASIAARDDQQRQSDAKQAVRSGNELTADQNANLTAELAQSLGRPKRPGAGNTASTSRQDIRDLDARTPHPSPSRPPRSGGRSQ